MGFSKIALNSIEGLATKGAFFGSVLYYRPDGRDRRKTFMKNTCTHKIMGQSKCLAVLAFTVVIFTTRELSKSRESYFVILKNSALNFTSLSDCDLVPNTFGQLGNTLFEYAAVFLAAKRLNLTFCINEVGIFRPR